MIERENNLDFTYCKAYSLRLCSWRRGPAALLYSDEAKQSLANPEVEMAIF